MATAMRMDGTVKARWTKQAIKLALRTSADPMVEAYVSEQAAGLGIHPTPSKQCWMVSHIPSGKSTGISARTLKRGEAGGFGLRGAIQLGRGRADPL